MHTHRLYPAQIDNALPADGKYLRFQFAQSFMFITLSTLLFGLLLSACQPVQPISESVAVAQAAEDNDSIGRQIAGSYLVDGHEFGLPENREMTYKMLMTFMADGTLVYEASMAFGADHPPRFKSGGHGSWQQTGPREITWTTLSFDYGQEETHPALGPFNPYASTVRITSIVTFDEAFESYTETSKIEVLPADRDPLDPATEPIFPAFQGERKGRRIPALFGS
ncbi:MAG: hypothetical protein R3C14_35075 [Caldilineaceae bacterium]